MIKNNYLTEAKISGRKTWQGTSVFNASDFNIDLITHDPEWKRRLHTCGKEEFFYVIKGNVEMQIENQNLLLKEGDAIMIMPGEKHKHYVLPGGSMMIVTKRPHAHKHFEE
jgi:quercetin dioxygenase-like cupin family protein